jgi:serine/threonine-protein kinase HipA
MVDVADVKIWGELIGAISWDEQQQLAAFQYDRRFIEKGYDLSPVKMPLSNGNRVYRFPELRNASKFSGEGDGESTFKGLPGLLADVLPDRYGNQLINNWLAQNGRPQNSMNPIEQLCFIGSRGMGALEFEPSKIRTEKDSFQVEIKGLVEIAQKMLFNRQELSLNLTQDEQKAMREILKIGTSAGGARPKAVVAYNAHTGEIRSGQADAPFGFEHWLLKMDGVSDAQFGASHGFGRVEYAYYLMAKDAGIDIMESKLLEENGRAHFMTKRFDREGATIKHHVQTFCAMQHYDYTHLYSFSYEQLFQTMRTLRLSYPEAEEMYRRMVFNVMATNYDDHTKNFGFILKQGKKWQLAPAYDVCFAYNESNAWVNQHTLSINGKHKYITKDDLRAIGIANNIRKYEQIITSVQEVVMQWKTYAEKANVNQELTAYIDGVLAAHVLV